MSKNKRPNQLTWRKTAFEYGSDWLGRDGQIVQPAGDCLRRFTLVNVRKGCSKRLAIINHLEVIRNRTISSC